MGFLSYLTDKFRGPYMPVEILKDWDKEDAARQSHFQKLYDYYIGDQDEISSYTIRSMSKTFKVNTINKMQLPYFLIVRRIIDRLAMVYLEPAVRYIEIPRTASGDEIVEDPEMSKANELYQEMLEFSNINAQCKVWHRYAKLLDTVYVQPIWRNDHIEYDIFPPHLLRVEEDEQNYLLPKTVQYNIRGEDNDSYTVVWSKDEHWVVDTNGKPVDGRNEWGGVNRYGVIPLLPLRLRETDDHWGIGDVQLVDINEKINILLASTYYNSIMQSHGQAVSVNFEFREGEEMQTGPDKIIQVKNVTKDMFPPDFRFVQPQPATKDCMAQIDWMLKTAAMSRGLPAASVSIDNVPQSGFAKIIDNWELMELRADDIEYLRVFERKLFEVSRVIWNYHNPSKKISLDAEFGIDFTMPKAPVSELDELNAKLIKLKLATWTPVEDFIDEDAGIDEEAAIGYVKKNIRILDELGIKAETPPATDNRARMEGSPGSSQGRDTQRGNQEQDNAQGDEVVPGAAKE